MDVKSPAAADSISRPSSTLSAPAEPSRVTVALRRAGIAVAGVGVAALTAAACVLSFEDLRDLAIIGEARPDLAYLYPAAFDALLVIAMIGVLLLRGGRWLVRLQAGVILVLLFAAAATAEVTTAMRTTTAMDVRQAAVVVAVAPWVILIVALWLWLLLIKHAAARRSAVDEAPADHERDIVPFPDADLPTAEHPAQPEWRTRPSRPDLQVHPDPLQHDRPVRRVSRPARLSATSRSIRLSTTSRSGATSRSIRPSTTSLSLRSGTTSWTIRSGTTSRSSETSTTCPFSAIGRPRPSAPASWSTIPRPRSCSTRRPPLRWSPPRTTIFRRASRWSAPPPPRRRPR